MLDNEDVSGAARKVMEMEADHAAEFRRRLLDIVDEAAENYRNANVDKRENIEDVRYSYDISEDKELYEFIVDSVEGRKGAWGKYEISNKINQRLAKDITELVGFDVSGFSNKVLPTDIAHIAIRHGKNGKTDTSMSDYHELAKVPYILENYDKIRLGGSSISKKNKDGSRAKTVELQKKIDEKYYYVVEAVPDAGSKTLYLLSAYINKNDTFSQVDNAKSPIQNVRNDSESDVSFSTDSISQNEENANKNVKFSLKVPVEETKDLILNGDALSDVRFSLTGTTNSFGLEEYSEHEKENFENGRTFFANTKEDIAEYVRNYVHKKPYSRILIGKIGADLAEKIKNETGVDVRNYNIAVTSKFENSHANEKKERSRGQVAMTPEMVALLPEIIGSYDKVEYAGINKQQQEVLRFEKDIEGRKVVVEYVSKGRKTIDLQTMYGWENKKDSHQASNAMAFDRTSKTDLDMNPSDGSISQSAEKSTENTKFSLKAPVEETKDLILNGDALSDVRFSLTGTNDLDEFWNNYNGFDDVIGNSASILEEGAEALQGKEVDTDLVRKIARKMKKEYVSKVDLGTFADNMVKVFSYFQTQDKANYEDMIRVMNEVAMSVIAESTGSVD